MSTFVSAIIPAAGAATRMGGPVRKPLLTIGGRPILIHTLRNLVRVKSINEIIIVVNPKDVELVQKELGQEPGQGVGYLDDGTMVVVESGREHLDRTVRILVTSVLQTSAGRMIFGRPHGS